MYLFRSRRQREQERRLEVENEQLLKRIIAQQSRVVELVSAGSGSLTRAQHVAPSTINRKRQQKFIHAQNLVRSYIIFSQSFGESQSFHED